MLTILLEASLFALVWTYCGYPLLMFLRARLKPHLIHSSSDFRPSVTLLIPAYNEADVIRRKLENSVALIYPPDKLQILVVDDDSDDGTGDIIREFAGRGVTVLHQSVRQGKMAGVHRGFENATGDIVVLSDASPDYEPHALEYLVRSFSDPTVGVVVGKLALWDAANAVAKPAGLYWRYEAAVRSWESATGSTVAVHGNMFALRRKLYRPLGSGIINDEFSLAMDAAKQGFRVVYDADAVCYDDASATMGDEFNRRVRINAGRYQGLVSASYLKAPADVVFRFISHKLLRSFAPLFMLALLISNVLLVVDGIFGLSAPSLLWSLLAAGAVGILRARVTGLDAGAA